MYTSTDSTAAAPGGTGLSTTGMSCCWRSLIAQASTAPPATTAPTIAAITTFTRLDGPDGEPGSSLALGFIVPMFGFGLNGLWAAFHGAFPRRHSDTDEAVTE